MQDYEVNSDPQRRKAVVHSEKVVKRAGESNASLLCVPCSRRDQAFRRHLMSANERTGRSPRRMLYFKFVERAQ